MATAPAIPGEDAAIALARRVEANKVRDPAALSLLRWWSEQGEWTPRQTSMAVALLLKSDEPIPGETQAVPPYPYTRGGLWHGDTRPERQALRGRKSGIMRRWRTRERDGKILYWRERGESLAALAARFGLSRSGIAYILRRVVSAPLPKLEAVQRTIRRVQSLGEVDPPSAIPVPISACPGQPRRIFRALARWCGLQTVKRLPDSAVQREAERLNAAEARPLKPARVAGIVRKVCRERVQWA